MATKRASTTLADRLRAELTKAQDRMAALEAERDRFGGAWSSAEYEAAAFRRQRDEAVDVLADLLPVVEKLEPAPPPSWSSIVHRARRLVEHYRSPAPATIERP